MRLPHRPVSACYGYDRGTPIDRYYINRFLGQHADRICGHVLEVKDHTYTRRFGGRHVTLTTIVDNDPTNEDATLRADLADARSLPSRTFDAIVLTQTLQLLRDPATAVRNLQQALRADGTLLLTVPTVGRISPSAATSDYWRITPCGLGHLLAETWHGPTLVTGYGNLRACLATLVGEAVEDLTHAELDRMDARFPVIACGLARRSP